MKAILAASLSIAVLMTPSFALADSGRNDRQSELTLEGRRPGLAPIPVIPPELAEKYIIGTLVFYDPSRNDVDGADPFVRIPLVINPANAIAAADDAARYAPFQ